MIQVSRRGKPLHQKYSELDNKVFSAFCDSFNIKWSVDFKDGEDDYSGIDAQLTAISRCKLTSYDVEIKSVHLSKMLPYCYFQADKWDKLIQWDNDYKLYFVIYPNHNKIAVWRVNSKLLRSSEKEYILMKKNTCKGENKIEKLVYKFKLSDAKVFNFDLTPYKNKYDALHQQRKN